MVASATDMPAKEKDYLFRLSLECVEHHNQMLVEPNLERFHWFIMTNFPFPAQVYLLCSLRYRTSDVLADRAWQQFESRYKVQTAHFHGTEFWRKHKESAIHLALANLTLKAWEAREKAQPGIPTPVFIPQLRQQIADKKPPKETNSPIGPEATTPSMPTTEVADQFAESYKWFNPGAVEPNQGFDVMPGLVTNDPQSMGWDFWNDLMQPTIPGYPYEGVVGPFQVPYSS
jgi:hypothetical protein